MTSIYEARRDELIPEAEKLTKRFLAGRKDDALRDRMFHNIMNDLAHDAGLTKTKAVKPVDFWEQESRRYAECGKALRKRK